MDLFGISAEMFIEALKEDFGHYKAPPLTFARYVEDFRKIGLLETAKRIEELRVLVDVASNGIPTSEQ